MAPPKGRIRSCAIAIGTDIYLFGGKSTFTWESYNNELWKLSNTAEESFSWKEIVAHSKEHTPSPRAFHSGWAYEGKLWIFGGEGPSPTGYLYPYNDDFHLFPGLPDHFANNQLLCFNLFEQRWSYVEQSGAIPSSRSSHATTVLEDKHKVWIYGGYNYHTHQFISDLHVLELSSFTWTLITTSPRYFQTRSLNVVGDTKLVLRADRFFDIPGEIWIFDMTSVSWRYILFRDCYRSSNTCCLGLDNSVVIIGGEEDGGCSPQNNNQCVFTVMLEPKSLQQLCIKMIHKHKHELTWEIVLPDQLLSRFRFL